MRTHMEEDFRATRAAIAHVARCPVEELALTRNTTESLDLVIAGHDWKAGDEVVFSAQDYGTMQAMFEQQAARHGIVCKRISIPLHPQSDGQIVALYASAFTERTRLVMVPHMINLTGQILPVQAIAAMARERNVAVMVDGAHAFAHIDFAIPELGCDYYAASLHKWLGCPLGAGLLWVRRDRIAGLWPLLAPPPGRASDDITRLNHLGTHPVHTTLAIRDAIAFHEELGIARKEARLRHLQQYWTSRVRQHPRIQVNTPMDPGRHCGIGNVAVKGLTPKQLEERLLKEFGIYTVGIDTADVHGVRVTPHVYTSEAELQRLVYALETLAG
jgi:selenocysteine lyase/cysteine desulfurase